MLTHDLRDAARNLRRHRGFAASAIAILAIGIAASTGLFAVVDAVVLHPLPYAGANRLARVQLLPPSGPVRRASVTADEFRTLRQASTLDGATSGRASRRRSGGARSPSRCGRRATRVMRSLCLACSRSSVACSPKGCA